MTWIGAIYFQKSILVGKWRKANLQKALAYPWYNNRTFVLLANCHKPSEVGWEWFGGGDGALQASVPPIPVMYARREHLNAERSQG
jgi:hypothetical protein